MFKGQFSKIHGQGVPVGGSFFVLVKRPRRENFERWQGSFKMFRVSRNIYKKYVDNCTEFHYKYFPYFKLVKCYGNYHYNFLVIKKDYCYG